jgi:hypothetical protein
VGRRPLPSYRLSSRQAAIARTALNDGGEIQKNAESVEALQAVQAELKQLCSARKASSRKVTIDSLPEAERETDPTAAAEQDAL